MEAGTKRRRFTSETSASSTSTQLTSVSEDSQQQSISPTYFVQSSDDVARRPVFRFDSQDNEESFVTKGNKLMPVYAGCRTNNGQQSFNCNGMPLSTGYKTNKPTSDISFEMMRRAQRKAAKRARPGRRQSESVIAEQHEYIFDPYRPSGMHLSIDNIGSFECQCNEELPQRHRSDEIGRQRQRARSVDTLERLHGNHVYDTPDPLPRRDTEVCMHQGNTRPVIKLSRKRLNSSLSETPPELNYDRDVTNYAESGYIRTGNVKAGFCELLSVSVKRHAFTILVVLNVLVLFVNFAVIPYVLMMKSKDGPDEEPNCFQCSDLPAPMLRDSIVNGHITQDGDRCCFKANGHTTTWVVQQVSKQSTRPFAYLSGRSLKEFNGEYRIQWDDNRLFQMKLKDKRTVVSVEEKGFYFLFSRVHYHGTDVSAKYSSVTISHSIKKKTASSESSTYLGMVSQKCRQGINSTNVEHNSVLETIAYLNEGDTVYIDVQMETLVNRSKDHTFGWEGWTSWSQYSACLYEYALTRLFDFYSITDWFAIYYNNTNEYVFLI